MRVALVQTQTPADQERALEHVAPLVREAAKTGASLILTPEAVNLIERRRDRRDAALRTEGDDPCVIGLRDLARELSVHLLIGSAMLKGEGGRAVNRSLLAGPDGEIIARYDKIHLFDVDLPTGESVRESDGVAPGGRAIVAPLPEARLGLTVCYDIRFPHLFRALARAGADLIAAPAAFTVPTGQAHWEVLLRARAIETGAFVLAPAQGGLHEDGRSTWGRSLIVDPWGQVVAAADHDRPCILGADLDLGASGRARAAIPQLNHDREFQGP